MLKLLLIMLVFGVFGAIGYFSVTLEQQHRQLASDAVALRTDAASTARLSHDVVSAQQTALAATHSQAMAEATTRAFMQGQSGGSPSAPRLQATVVASMDSLRHVVAAATQVASTLALAQAANGAAVATITALEDDNAALAATNARLATRVAAVPSVSPSSTPGPSPGSYAAGQTIHMCSFSHFDQTHTRCLQEDDAVDLTQQIQTQVVWPASQGIDTSGNPIFNDEINVLRQDGTGAWVDVGQYTVTTYSTAGLAMQQSPQGRVSDTLQQIMMDAGAPTDCNTSWKLQVTSSQGGKLLPALLIRLTC